MSLKPIALLAATLFFTACGNNSDILALADPSGSTDALLLLEKEPLEARGNLLGLDLFTLFTSFNEAKPTQSRTLERSLLYVDHDASVFTERLFWDRNVSMWSSRESNNRFDKLPVFKLWNGTSWDRIEPDAKETYLYERDGTLVHYLQSAQGELFELESSIFQGVGDLSGQIYTFEANHTVMMPQGAIEYSLSKGLRKSRIFVLDDGNTSLMEEGPSLEYWDDVTHLWREKSFPTLSSFLYRASLYDVVLGKYTRESHEALRHERIEGAYYPLLYEAHSSFGALSMEGTRYFYDDKGEVLGSESFVTEGGSWAFVEFEDLTVLELVGIDGELSYFAVEDGMVKYLSVELAGKRSSEHYINEIAVDAIAEHLIKEGVLN